MSKRTRNVPIATIDGVNVLGPSGTSKYYRLTWTNPDGSAGRTTAGRERGAAIARAEEVADDLRKAALGLSDARLADLVDKYTATRKGRNQRQTENGKPGDWTEAQRRQVSAHLRRAIVGNEDIPAYLVDRPLLDRLRAQGGTPRMVRENTSALRGLLRWAQPNGYLTVEQSELLPYRCAPVDPALSVVSERPERYRTARMVGQHHDYVPDEDAPFADQIVALATQFQERADWGRLAVELAAGAGLRWGEQHQLRAYDVEIRLVDGRRLVFVRIDWQVNSAARRTKGDPLRVLPKGRKRRLVKVTGTSITGYPLADELVARAEQARTEQHGGTNPDALLFPTASKVASRRATHVGGLWHHTAWSRDLFIPAALAAGWEASRWVEIHADGTVRDRLQMIHPWHSLRHRFARTAIDVWDMQPGELMAQGGWENVETVYNRYYRSGIENWESSCTKIPD